MLETIDIISIPLTRLVIHPIEAHMNHQGNIKGTLQSYGPSIFASACPVDTSY